MTNGPFTKDELDLIIEMLKIAADNKWGVGDYAEWDKQTSTVYNALLTKIWQMRGLYALDAEKIAVRQ